jgi:hypothetical protein
MAWQNRDVKASDLWVIRFGFVTPRVRPCRFAPRPDSAGGLCRDRHAFGAGLTLDVIVRPSHAR